MASEAWHVCGFLLEREAKELCHLLRYLVCTKEPSGLYAVSTTRPELICACKWYVEELFVQNERVAPECLKSLSG
jgi:hypothetical protein